MYIYIYIYVCIYIYIDLRRQIHIIWIDSTSLRPCLGLGLKVPVSPRLQLKFPESVGMVKPGEIPIVCTGWALKIAFSCQIRG